METMCCSLECYEYTHICTVRNTVGIVLFGELGLEGTPDFSPPQNTHPELLIKHKYEEGKRTDCGLWSSDNYSYLAF